MELTFHLAAFDGPLDLLLHLIEKNKVNIYDIPIAMIPLIAFWLNTLKRFPGAINDTSRIVAIIMIPIRIGMDVFTERNFVTFFITFSLLSLKRECPCKPPRG